MIYSCSSRFAFFHKIDAITFSFFRQVFVDVFTVFQISARNYVQVSGGRVPTCGTVSDQEVRVPECNLLVGQQGSK